MIKQYIKGCPVELITSDGMFIKYKKDIHFKFKVYNVLTKNHCFTGYTVKADAEKWILDWDKRK